ncbi:VOC family protein [Candidatus Palauibacter sp.]|uniref:VOC family protein n=1 Tax=Candidatus Palauibacter sp. TaxID=3101350 RepID=UPI003B51E1C1
MAATGQGLTPMLVVRDVAASSAWYVELFGLVSGRGGHHFERLLGQEGSIELMLHHREFKAHPGMTDPCEGTPGRGVLLYFYTEDAQAVFERARALGADCLDEPHENPNARSIEFTLRDPDGYPISVSQRLSRDG